MLKHYKSSCPLVISTFLLTLLILGISLNTSYIYMIHIYKHFYYEFIFSISLLKVYKLLLYLNYSLRRSIIVYPTFFLFSQMTLINFIPNFLLKGYIIYQMFWKERLLQLLTIKHIATLLHL